MGLESKNSSLRLETVEEAEKRIEGLTPSLEETSPIEEAAPSSEGVGNAQSIETQRIAEQNEAAELLEKMHEAAGAPQEAVEAVPSAGEEQEKTLSSEQAVQQEAEKLYESLSLSRDFKESKYAGASGEGLFEKIRLGLGEEEVNDENTRTQFFKRAAVASGVGATVGIGGLTFLGAGAATLGFATGGLAFAVGGLGWAGMKAFHALKERRHKKAFDKLRYGA